MSSDKYVKYSRLGLLAVLCLIAVAAAPIVMDVANLDGG